MSGAGLDLREFSPGFPEPLVGPKQSEEGDHVPRASHFQALTTDE